MTELAEFRRARLLPRLGRDRSERAGRPHGRPVNVPPPWVTALCATNALVTCLIEILLLYGMLQDPLPAYVVPAAFAFLLRAEIEIIYGSQLIWRPAPLRGGALINYLAIGLVPRVLIPCLVALRFSGLGVTPLSLLLFVGLPIAILVWTWIVYRNNPVCPRSTRNKPEAPEARAAFRRT